MTGSLDGRRGRIARALPLVIAAVAAAMIAAFSIFSWHSYQALRREQAEQSAEQANRTRVAFANHVTRLLDHGDSYLRVVRQIYLQAAGAGDMRAALAEIAAPNADSFAGVVLVMDADGTLVFHSGEVVHTQASVADLPWFQALRADPRDRVIVDPTRVGRATGRPQFRLVRPLSRDGRFAGAVVLTMKPESITEYYRDLNLGPHTASMLLTTDLQVIAREPAVKDEDFSGPIPGLNVWRDHDLEREPVGSLRQKSVIDGISRTFYYAKLADYPLVVSVGVADDDVAARSAEAGRNLALLASAFAVTVMVVAWLLVAVVRTNGQLRQANRIAHRAVEDVGHANARLQRANTLLERSNSDLEQFAYVASHDLQTPLRNMTSFAQLLQHRYAGQLDQDGRDFLGFIVAGAQQMSNLITDLLDYSRVSSQGTPLAPVAADQALAAALAAIGPALDASAARIEAHPLPTLLADAGQLARLFQNLIENALKYRHPDRAPVVRLWAETTDAGMWKIFVADNGIGIEPAYFDKIFVIFQRLHPVGRYEGTGIGLALCKRIVTRMGGEIGLTSEPGRGSTFFFTAHGPEGA